MKWDRIGSALAVFLLVAGVTLYLYALLGTSARDAVEEAARIHCRNRGWPEKLAPRRYRDTGAGLIQGFQQEFEIDGTEPRMTVWVEVRRPLYLPVWRVHDIVESRPEEPD